MLVSLERAIGYIQMCAQCAVMVAALRFLRSKIGCNSKAWDEMGDLCRQHLVVRAGLKCPHRAFVQRLGCKVFWSTLS